MKRVMIVDDEILVRMGLRSLIDWESHGYTIVGDAADGKEALGKLPLLKPDLIFTDLKMDGMDGFMLMERCRELYPEMKFVVLSSYNDFDNVRRALRLGATDYVFKLEVKPVQLIKLLGELKWADATSHVLKNNLRALKNSLIHRAVSRDYHNEEAFLREFADLGLDSDWSEPYCLLSISPDNFDAMRQGRAYDEMNGAIESIESVLMEVIKEEMALYPFDANLLLVVFKALNDSALSHLQKQFATAADYIHRYLGMTITAAMSDTHEGIGQMPDAFAQNEQTLSHRYYLQDGRIHGYHPRPLAEPRELPDYLSTEAFEKALALGEADTLRYMSACFSYFSKTRTHDLPDIRTHLSTLYQALLRCFERDCKSLLTWQTPRGLDMPKAIMLCDKLSAVEDAFGALMKAYFENRDAAPRMRREIAQTLSFVKAHLGEEISVQSAARHVNMSESYFAHVFKKEMHTSFIDYLNRERIKQAERLLKHTDEKINEIALQVGIENANYFSSLFKKTTGLTPQEMRKKQNHKA